MVNNASHLDAFFTAYYDSQMLYSDENPNCLHTSAEKPLNEWVLYQIPHENVSSEGNKTTSPTYLLPHV